MVQQKIKHRRLSSAPLMFPNLERLREDQVPTVGKNHAFSLSFANLPPRLPYANRRRAIAITRSANL
jgi:hypothetical protein